VVQGDIEKIFYFDGSKNMISERTKVRHHKLGELLVNFQILEKTHVDYALQQQQQAYTPLGQILVELGYCQQSDIENALRAQMQEEVLDLLGVEEAVF
jgi:hypothetical protein